MIDPDNQTSPNTGLEDLASAAYVSTPRGIFTRSGVQFHTTEELLKEFAGEVLEKESLSSILQKTELWLRSPSILGVCLLPVLLLLVPVPLLAASAVLLVYLLWEVFGPGFAGPALTRLARIGDNVVFQFVLYAVALGVLASVWQAAEAVIYGLAGFVLFRWNVISRMFAPLYERIRKPMYALPVADEVLRMMIIRCGMQNGISLEPIKEMESRLLRALGK